MEAGAKRDAAVAVSFRLVGEKKLLLGGRDSAWEKSLSQAVETRAAVGRRDFIARRVDPAPTGQSIYVTGNVFRHRPRRSYRSICRQLDDSNEHTSARNFFLRALLSCNALFLVLLSRYSLIAILFRFPRSRL